MDADEQIDTPLARKIKDRIRQTGPMLIAEYMDACLHNPEFGYYRTQKAIGAAADFITAPEISQVFGELIGIWAAVTWRAMSAPSEFNLIEIGPGRGTLMADALRAASVVPRFIDAARIHLIESNPHLQREQLQKLAPYGSRISWHPELVPAGGTTPDGRSIPDIATIIIANEYFDTVPTNQWVARNGQWNLRTVELTENRFEFAENDNAPATLERPDEPVPADGTIRQWAGNASWGQIAAFNTRGCVAPLAMLLIDYGFAGSATGETLQAMSAHQYVSPFRAPGVDDLTMHVDFERMAALFRSPDFFDEPGFKSSDSPCHSPGLLTSGPITQSEFLLRMGLVERTQALMASARTDQINAIETGARRIADPNGMGGLFKVLCVRSKDVPLLPPFLT